MCVNVKNDNPDNPLIISVARIETRMQSMIKMVKNANTVMQWFLINRHRIKFGERPCNLLLKCAILIKPYRDFSTCFNKSCEQNKTTNEITINTAPKAINEDIFKLPAALSENSKAIKDAIVFVGIKSDQLT